MQMDSNGLLRAVWAGGVQIDELVPVTLTFNGDHSLGKTRQWTPDLVTRLVQLLS